MNTTMSIGWVALAFALAAAALATPARGAAQDVWRDIDNERAPAHLPDPTRGEGATGGGGDVGMEVLGGVAGFAAPVAIAMLAYGVSGDTATLALLGLAPFGVTAGVYLAGEATGGHGSIGYTFLGQAIGGAIAAPIAFGLLLASVEKDEHCGDFDDPCDGGDLDPTAAWTIGILTSAALTVGGGVLAYELSDEGGAQLSVSLAPSTHGGAVGLTGRF